MRVRGWAWLAALITTPAAAGAQAPALPDTAVRAILFYSPTCPHCQEVITQSLPPILDRYGARLQIAGVNTATPGGEQLFRAAILHLAIPPERVGVPTLVVGSTVLVGSLEIPDRLPGIVEEGLKGAGIDWPDVPLIRQALEAQGVVARSGTPADTVSSDQAVASGPEPEAQAAAPAEGTPPEESRSGQGHGREAPVDTARTDAATPEVPPGPDSPPEMATPESDERVGESAAALAGAIDPDARAALVHQLSVVDRLMLDPAGNATALAVLVLMLAALAIVAGDVVGRLRIPPAPAWVVPALAVIGILVASYLAFVEVSNVEAVCGPVGDCNTVQQSKYARLAGVPVGILGVLGYGALLTIWLLGRTGAAGRRRTAQLGIWWLTLVAVLFSVYLTVLEPFVIGASCAWCLTSALVTMLLLLAATPGRRGASAARVGVSPTDRPSVSH